MFQGVANHSLLEKGQVKTPTPLARKSVFRGIQGSFQISISFPSPTLHQMREACTFLPSKRLHHPKEGLLPRFACINDDR
ncbi:hypothetical protein LIER_21394 [Lithospermum erythrorhizon]|uniref:Uncharacterized protein n=1 Tax=Lithospermum erythrorhizon TaxID=34254 RepID=A0AAV3QQ38_LITER